MDQTPASRKDEKLRELIRALAADFISKESNRTSLVTVTNVLVSDRGQRVAILFTVMPERSQDAILDFLTRKGDEFRQYVRTHARLGRLPFISFKIDYGEKNRQRADELLG